MRKLHFSSGLLLGVLAALAFFGSGHASADCGINTGNIHDYAGLRVTSKWVGDDGNTNISNNNTVTVSEHNGSGASDSIGGNIVVMSKVQESYVPGARFKSVTFKQIGGCGPSMVVLPGDYTNGSPAVGSGTSDWGLDCDNSKLGTNGAGQPLFQQFDITGNGVPNGARAGGYWGVAMNNPSPAVTADHGANAAGNGQTLDVTIWYTQPAKTGTPPPTPTPASTGLSCSALTYDSGTVVVGGRSYTIQADIYLSGATPFGSTYLSSHINNNSPASGNHSVNIIPTSQSVTMSVVEFYVQGGSIHYVIGSFTGSTPNPVAIASAGPCYSADCTLTVDTGLPNNDMVPGQPFTVTATINNDSVLWPGLGTPQPIPNTLDGGTVQFQNNGGTSGFAYGLTDHAGPGFSLDGGGTTIQFTATASSAGSVVGQLASAGKYFIGSACASAPLNLYQPPIVTVGAACQSNIFGVAYDNYIPGFPIYVDIYADGPAGGGGTFIGEVQSNGPGLSYSLAVPASYQNGANHTFYAYGIDPFGVENGGPATVTMTGCESFHVTPGANSGELLNCPTPVVVALCEKTPESPNYFGSLSNDTSVTVTYGAGGTSYYGPSAASYPGFPGVPVNASYTYTKNGVPVSSGPIPSPTGTGRFIDSSYQAPFLPVGPLLAGDAYCIYSQVTPSDGFIQNDGTVLSSSTNPNPDDSLPSCDTVVNRPFFKAYNTGISAGGAFKALNASGSGGGELAGWNNNSGTYPTSGDFGANAELNTLALTKIAGVASGQGRSFGGAANRLSFADNPITSDAYTPILGGAFDPGGSGYYLNDQAAPTGGDTSTSMPALPLVIPLNDQKSVFITGNAYISGNIVYNGSGGGWTLSGANKVPSFVLHATGNIYIAPGVTQLDGLYIAQGEIYTCANAAGPLPSTVLYGSCNNQLTVNGSFVASQINMMRTFGSLRDETPAPGSAARPLAGGEALTTPPSPRPPQYVHLCNSSSGITYVTHGNPKCLPGDTWVKDYGPGVPRTFYATPCATTSGPTMRYVYISAAESCPAGTSSSLSASGPATPKTANPCSNAPAGDLDGSNGGVNITLTCAAEVFQFSPELFLSSPNVAPPSNGAPQWDAVTSLPPVL